MLLIGIWCDLKDVDIEDVVNENLSEILFCYLIIYLCEINNTGFISFQIACHTISSV